MRSFQELMARAVGIREKVLAVVAAHDDDVLLSIKEAYAQGLARAILLGDREKIVRLAAEINMDLSSHWIIHQPDPEEASRLAVSLVREGEADILMKGLLPSPVILKEVLHRERGLRTENILSHIAVFEVPGYDRLFFMSDSGLNIAPSLEVKIGMVKNAVDLAHRLGIEQPRVAIIAGIELVNPDMPSSVDAALIAKMAERGQIKGCLVDGPLSLDLAVSEEAARAKGVGGAVAGRADILIMPGIDAANVLYKAIGFLVRSVITGIILGAKAPIILTSRADTAKAKLYSIALSSLIVEDGQSEREKPRLVQFGR